ERKRIINRDKYNGSKLLKEVKTEGIFKKREERIEDKKSEIAFEQIKKEIQIISMNEKIKELEAQLKKFEEEKVMRNSEYIKSLARIVHDMKNPLTTIKGGIELLLEQNVNETQKHVLDLMYKSAADLSNMIEDILLNNKILHNAIELNKEEFDLISEIRRIYESALICAKMNNKNMHFDCADEKMIFYGDRNKINRAIGNLLMNAIKYSNTSVYLKIYKENEKIIIIISDDGNGFNEEVREKILMDKEMTSTDLINGNGFGLTNAKKIIEMHEGYMTIESNIPNGASVRVEIPIKSN
ncbi:MAG: HAMP domain-containing histidine kinase, partial [Candidatus Micrarchaeota archaeon]|nr:HAMP domain-containing histidine kinase [Candidatus Micrarchaeota archaeon]